MARRRASHANVIRPETVTGAISNPGTCSAMEWCFCRMDAALIDGGTIQYDPFYGQPQVAAFHPASNTFTNVQNMAHGRWYPTVLTLGNGRVMAFSGLNETGGTNTAVEFYTVARAGARSTPHPGRRTSTHACTFYLMARCFTLERKQPLSSSIHRRRRGTRTSPEQSTAEPETTAHRCCSR